MTNLEQQLAERYAAEGIDPLTGAYCILGDKIYRTVAGMEILAMRSGLLCGKDSVEFGEVVEVTNPQSGTTVTVPGTAIATYYRFCMDKVCKFQSDPVQFFDYANNAVRWHFEKGHLFLAKIARSCALRHAFPDIFAGTISYEEAQCELAFDASASRTVKKTGKTVKLAENLPNGKPAEVAENVAEIIALPNVKRESVSKLVANIFQK